MPAVSGPLIQLQVVGIFLKKQIVDAVAVDVDQLRTRVLEAPEEWKGVGMAGGVENFERRNAAVKNKGGRGGNGRQRLCARGNSEQRERQPQGFPPATPTPAPSGAVSTRPTTARRLASITISRPGAAVMPAIGIAMLMPPMFITLSVL